MNKNYRIAVLPGDGIGPEIMEEGYKILDIIKNKFSISLEYESYDVGGIAIDKYGIALPEKTIIGCKNSDAILFGSVGGKKWDNLPTEKKPEIAALLSLRKIFNLFVNLRPAKLYSNLLDLSPLRKDIISSGFDILCVRELVGGIYYGLPKGRKIDNNKDMYAFDTSIYYEYEIERIVKIAFEIARNRRKKLTSVDKSNVLETSVLWREVVDRISKYYTDIELNHLYVDNASMQIIRAPFLFDVLLCPNLFGDILSDECGMITGSIGMLPSASLNNTNFGLYEPAGGSAPDLVGKNIANPIALILSIAMLFRYSLKLSNISDLIENAVEKVLKDGFRTFDIRMNDDMYLTTKEMGNKIAYYLKNKE